MEEGRTAKEAAHESLTLQKVGGYRSGPGGGGAQICGGLGEQVPTRSDGETTDRGLHMSRKGAGECCLLREAAGVAWPRTGLQHNIVATESSRTVGGLGTGGGQA